MLKTTLWIVLAVLAVILIFGKAWSASKRWQSVPESAQPRHARKFK